MMREGKSTSAADLWERLDALEDEESGSEAFGLGDLSTLRMMQRQRADFHFVNARFTGALPERHAIGVREATAALGSLQDVLSEVGAVIMAQTPKRGPLPSEVLASTALRFSPQVMPGSVIFSLRPARDTALVPAETTVLDTAISEVFDLFDQVERPVSSHGTLDSITGVLRRFGPRTARHLARFASTLRESDLNLDLGVARSGTKLQSSRISTAGADFLRKLAKDATSRTDDVTIVGEVFNLGKDNKHKVDDVERGRIVVTASDEVTDLLHTAFKQSPVRIEAKETQTVTAATGATTYAYEAVTATILESE